MPPLHPFLPDRSVYLTSALRKKEKNLSGTPMHRVSPLNYRFPLHMLRRICSTPARRIGFTVAALTALQLVRCTVGAGGGVIVYRGLELEKQACHLSEL